VELHIVIQGRRDLSGQLYRQLRDAIQSGRLAGGAQMPPSRLLSEQLGVSRKTVAEVYAKLTLDKLLVGQVGIGTFVNAGQPQQLRQQTGNDLAGAAVVKRWTELATPLRHPSPEGQSRYEFIGGGVNKVPFPMEEWHRCVKNALRQGDQARGRYGQTEGLLACAKRWPVTSVSPGACAAGNTTLSLPMARSKPSIWWRGCWWSRERRWPWKNPATHRHGNSLPVSKQRSSASRWTPRGLWWMPSPMSAA
jgi:DNA-binding transcriptional regulator YhcF (GntR family)